MGKHHSEVYILDGTYIINAAVGRKHIKNFTFNKEWMRKDNFKTQLNNWKPEAIRIFYYMFF